MMIREDVESTITSKSGQFYILSVELLEKLTKSTNDIDLLQKVIDGGGDLLNLELPVEGSRNYTGNEVKCIKKWRVDNDGENEAIIVLQPANMKSHRFLMAHEPTLEEYINSRLKELGYSLAPDCGNADEAVGMLKTLQEEYQKLTSS